MGITMPSLKFFIFSFTLLASSISQSQYLSSSQWFHKGQQQAVEQLALTANTQRAKNIILVVGDGMGVATLTAARIHTGQQVGAIYGEEYSLSFENFPYSALLKTYNTDQQTSDSAGTMTALVAGQKTKAGMLSISDKVERGDCAGQKGNELATIFDLARSQKKSTGIVTTSRLTHATPAALYAHSSERNWESNDALNVEAISHGCRDIAEQLIDQQKNKPLTIAFGGGRRHFLPEELGGRRLNNENLIDKWQSAKQHFYLENAQQLQQMDVSKGSHLGLFATSHLKFQHQRPADQPSLLLMTQKAVGRLNQNKQGYALMIEAGRIDHGHHKNNAYAALNETRELADTVDWLVKNVDLQETLIIVTADHSHTFTLAGYNVRGANVLAPVMSNDVYGEPEESHALADDGKAYTSAGYRNGASAEIIKQTTKHEHQVERADITQEQALALNYKQQSLVPLKSQTHGGEDVPLYAIGPWAHLFGSTMEQHWVYHVIKHAMTVQP